MMSNLFVICTLFLGIIGLNLKDSNDLVGVYGSYMDWSTYIELELRADNTFKYVDQRWGEPGAKGEGKWKVEGRRLFLESRIDSAFNIPNKWKIRGDKLVSENVERFRGKESQILKRNN